MSEEKQSQNADRLIARIELEAEAECARILDAARAEAAELSEASRRQALQRVRSVVSDLRREGARAVAKLRSRIETERRQLRQRQGLKDQQRGLDRLGEAMDALWQETPVRKLWCERVAGEARAGLLSGLWTVGHPDGWDEGERAEFAAAVADHTGQAPRFERLTGVTSGLVVQADAARLDATGPALCRDTPRLRALMQRELYAAQDEERS